MTTPPGDTLDDLVFEYLERVESGAAPDDVLRELAGGEEARRRELESSIEALRSVGLLPDEVRMPEEIAGFRPSRRLGAGGMGVVFLAEHARHGRVALKLIRPEQVGFERVRSRFRRELDSTARLAHPSIAAFVEAGEAGGLPYLAQEWVPGVSLDALLARARAEREPPRDARGLQQLVEALAPPEATGEAVAAPRDEPWDRAVARLLAQVARALQHAHEAGVLHRDVKPSNIVVRLDGRAVLIDFGLARLQGAESLTGSGAQPGSLPYMAPEQLDGEESRVDARSDVYSLGVTFYELLTLHQPFRAHAIEKLRGLILTGEAIAPRRLDSRIGAAAELVCLKAMDPEPSRRYASAAAFADELERCANETPVRARPLGARVRVVRWARRRPWRAAALVLFTVGPLGWALVAQWALGRVEQAYRDEQAARASADRHLEATLATIRTLVADLADGSLAQTPKLQRTRREALERALAIAATLEEELPDSVAVRSVHAQLHRLYGDVLGDLGEHERARQAYSAQLALSRTLVDEVPESERYEHRREIALGSERRAAIRIAGGVPREALGEYRDALALVRALAVERPDDVAAASQLLVSLQIYARILAISGEAQAAFEAADEGLRLSERLQVDFPEHPMRLTNAAKILDTWLDARAALAARGTTGTGGTPGAGAVSSGPSSESAAGRSSLASDEEVDDLDASRRALDWLERAMELDPDGREHQEEFARQAIQYALTATQRGELEGRGDLVALCRRGIEAVQWLDREFPSIERYSELLIDGLGAYGVVLVRHGEREEGVRLLERQADAAERLFARRPDQPEAARRAARALQNWVSAQVTSLQDYEGALRTAARTEAALEVALGFEPTNPGLLEGAALSAYSQGLALCLADRPLEVEPFALLLEERSVGDVRTRLLIADLWAEWVASLDRGEVAEPELRAEGVDRCLEVLEELERDGLLDRGALTSSNIFPRVLAGEPRWDALLR